ncbi:MAG: glycosyltransferase [Candidatus Aminicenantes bacterium]|nr:glycosyltransferase [Candidatus Aminicenantes bacterium]
MKFHTALRPWAIRRLEKIDKVDLVIGIPCFNNDSTIEHVIDSASEGIAKYYKDLKSVIIISDGGSTDDTRELAKEKTVSPYIEKIVTIYRGIPGKGSALRMIFEAVNYLNAKACILCDADLRSITPEWVKALGDPVLAHNHDFVAPIYSRYKYDATITNNIAYNLTRALFGKRIRQPIGGDFGLSGKMVNYYFYHEKDIWMTDIAKFGIDIWMTFSAIMQDVSIAQAFLGTKVHDVKDPVESLGPMFRQVVHTIFQLMEIYEDKWKNIKRSVPVPVYGKPTNGKVEEFSVDIHGMIRNFKEGFNNFSALWERIINPQSFAVLKNLSQKNNTNQFQIPKEDWAKIVYDFAVTFHRWKRDRGKLVDIMRPLYYACVASFINETSEMTTAEAEEIIDQQAQVFEDLKPYLLEKWGSLNKASV